MEYKTKIPKGGFAIVFDDKGEVVEVSGYTDTTGKDFKAKWEDKNMSQPKIAFRRQRKIEDVKNITLLNVSASPGNWCVIDGQRRRCP